MQQWLHQRSNPVDLCSLPLSARFGPIESIRHDSGGEIMQQFYRLFLFLLCFSKRGDAKNRRLNMLISSGPPQQWESGRPRVLFLSHRRLSLPARPSANGSSRPAFPLQASPESPCSRRVARSEDTERVNGHVFSFFYQKDGSDGFLSKLCVGSQEHLSVWFIYSAWRENVNTLPVNEALRPDAGLDPASEALVCRLNCSPRWSRRAAEPLPPLFYLLVLLRSPVR